MYFNRSTALIVTLICFFGFIGIKATSPEFNKFKIHTKHLLNIVGVENEYQKFLSYINVIPPENPTLKALYNEYFSFDSYLTDLIKFYSKHYTLDDINHLVSFYSSPLGKKTLQFNRELSRHMEDTMLNKISDYVFTSTAYGYNLPLL